MTTKKADKPDEPAEFNWVSMSQPTPEDDTPWEVQKAPSNNPGPYWVEDANGNQFATYILLKGLTLLDESPFNRSGDLRTPTTPGGDDTAPAA
jgi:hypothetical protein